MTDQPIVPLRRLTVNLFARAGVYSSSPGSSAPPEGFGAILIHLLLGAFLGLLTGIILLQLVRYVSFVLGRNLGGYSWVIYCTLAGAALFTWLALGGGKD